MHSFGTRSRCGEKSSRRQARGWTESGYPSFALPCSRPLALDEVCVESAAREELRMRALLGHTALVQHEDAIGRADGRQAMSDQDRGAIDHQRVECAAHQVLAQRVEVRC